MDSNCSDLEIQMQFMFRRDLPSVSLVVRRDAVGDGRSDRHPVAGVQLDALRRDSLASRRLQQWNHALLPPLVRFASQLGRRIPRLFYLYDSTEPEIYDIDSSKFNDLQLSLSTVNSGLFGKQYYWTILTSSPVNSTLNSGVEFWVINENVLSRPYFWNSWSLELLASGISSLGSASITGLYVIVLITVGTYFRGFLVPSVSSIPYITMPDPLPILELICGLYITRIDQYKYGGCFGFSPLEVIYEMKRKFII